MTELNDVPNYTNMFAQAFQAGSDAAKAKGVRNALSMAPTDPTGAAAALTQYGEFQGANALMQNAASQRALKVQQDVAPKVQSGNYAGAAQDAAAQGQYDLSGQLSKMDETQRAHAAQTADIMGKAAFGLAQLPQEQRAAKLQSIAPILVQQGIPQEMIAKADLSDQGLAQIAGQAMTVKDQIAAQQKNTEIQNTAEHNKAELAMTGQKFQEEQRHNHVSEGISAQNARTEAAKAASSQVQVLQDRDGTPYTYNAGTRVATTLDGQPYAPKGAQKLGSSNPRSAVAMATQRFMQDNPDATAEDLANFNASMGKKTTAAKAFATGKQGQTVNSLNVGISHLGALQGYADALQNGNVQLLNQAGNAVKTQLGIAAPTNFNAAKQIVGDEVVKAIVGAGGTGGDREKAQSIISAASSPAQLAGAIKTVKTLMAGQLHGLRLQYKTSTGLDDFESHLTPEAAKELEAIPVDATAPAPIGGSKPSLQSIFGH